jgi:hypothetical protein
MYADGVDDLVGWPVSGYGDGMMAVKAGTVTGVLDGAATVSIFVQPAIDKSINMIRRFGVLNNI